MKTVKLYEKGEEVMIRGTIDEVAMDGGDIVYQVKSSDTGKNMGIWFKDDQLLPAPKLEKSTGPIIEG